MSRTLASAPLHGALRAGWVSLVAFVAFAALMAAPVAGQTVAASFDELRFKVKAGDTVYVTDVSGKPEQEGRILELSASSLAVSIGGVRRDLVEGNVQRVRQRLPDSKKNGALIGFLVGAAGSVAAAKTLESPSGSCGGGCVAVNVLYGGGIGGLVGLGIDALIQGRKDVYVSGASRSSQEVVVRPFVTFEAKGLNISFRF